MRNYDLVVSSVKRILKSKSKDFVMGYIASLWDWDTIDSGAYISLKDLVEGKGDIL
jgi:hypothetical protein